MTITLPLPLRTYQYRPLTVFSLLPTDTDRVLPQLGYQGPTMRLVAYWLEHDSDLNTIRDNPRYKAIVQAM